MTKYRIVRATILAYSLLLSQVLSIPAYADDIHLAGQTVFTVQSGAGTSVAERTKTIQDNLDNALVATPDRSPNSVGVTYVDNTPVLTVGGYQVVVLNQSDATAANTNMSALAQQWATKLKQALGNKSSVDAYVAQINGTGASQTATGSASNPVTATYPPSAAVNAAPPGRYADQYNAGQNNAGQTAASNLGAASNSVGYNGQAPGFGVNPNYGATSGAPGTYGNPPGNLGEGYRQGRVAYAQAGQVIPVKLQTSISTQVAHTGDLIQASISQNILLGDSQIPSGSVVVGQVTAAEAGRRLTRSGELGIKFTTIRTPDGIETPIQAHLVGGLSKYHAVAGQQDTVKGEGMGNKIGSVAFRGLLGAGGGAALGTAVGAIAGGGHGAGAGAWSGTAIGGGLGAADSLLLRKGKDVIIPSGTEMQIQLDAPVSIAGVVPATGGGYSPPNGGQYPSVYGYGQSGGSPGGFNNTPYGAPGQGPGAGGPGAGGYGAGGYGSTGYGAGNYNPGAYGSGQYGSGNNSGNSGGSDYPPGGPAGR